MGKGWSKNRLCSFVNCNRKHEAGGYCDLHYRRFRRHGDPSKTLKGGFEPRHIGCDIINCGGKHYAKGFCSKHYRILFEYKLKPDEYNNILKNQDYRCVICKNPLVLNHFSTHIDHDHKTGKVRGLLCSSCNLVLGFSYEQKEILYNSIIYLERDGFLG